MGVTQKTADARENTSRRRHRWSAPDRQSSELTIRLCEKCGCVWHSRHDWKKVHADSAVQPRIWSEYYAERNPELKLTVMPECEGS